MRLTNYLVGSTALLAAAGLTFIGASIASSADDATRVTAQATAATPVASRPTTRRTWNALVLYPVWSRKAPRPNARRVRKVSPLAPYNRGPQRLLVLRAASSARYGVWYLVRLPFRPNTAAAWVPAAALKVRPTAWRVKIDVSARRAMVLRSGRRVATYKVAVGRSSYPTPTGRFAISEIVRQSNPRAFFGPYIMTLTAHSDRLNRFDGGRGRVAMHGTSRPSLLGSAASHGCIRFSNAAITKIARRVPPGTPVDVVP